MFFNVSTYITVEIVQNALLNIISLFKLRWKDNYKETKIILWLRKINNSVYKGADESIFISNSIKMWFRIIFLCCYFSQFFWEVTLGNGES